MEIVYCITIYNNSGTLYISDTLEPGDFSIEADSMCLTNILCDGKFELGKLNASMFEASIYSLDHRLEVGGFNITVDEQTYDDDTLVSTRHLFKGIIDSAKADTANVHRDIVAYDNLYWLRDKNITDFWNSTTTVTDENNPEALFDCSIVGNVVTWLPTPLYKIRWRLCKHFGFNFVDESSPITQVNDTATFTRESTDISGITFGQALSMVCEIQAITPHIVGNGYLEFVSVSPSATAVDITANYDTVQSTFESYETTPIDSIGIYSTSEELSMTIMPRSGEAPVNSYPIVGNVFLLSGILELAGSTGGTPDSKRYEVLMNTRDAIEGLTYTPAEIVIVETDFSLDLGQKIEVTRTDYWDNAVTTNHFIWGIVYSGSMFVDQKLNCPAKGETYSQKPSSANDEFSFGGKFSKMEQGLEEISAEVGTKADSTHAGQSFGWQLTASGFILTSNGNQVMKVDGDGLSVQGSGIFGGIIYSENDELANQLPILQVDQLVGQDSGSFIDIAKVTSDEVCVNQRLRLVGGDDGGNTYVDSLWAERIGSSAVTNYGILDISESDLVLSGNNIQIYGKVKMYKSDGTTPLTFTTSKQFTITLTAEGYSVENQHITRSYKVTVTIEAGQFVGSGTARAVNREWDSIDSFTKTCSPSTVIYITYPSSTREAFRFHNDLVPYFGDTTDLGNTSYRFRKIYLTTSPDVSSDRTLKKDFKDLDIYDTFFDKLKPMSFLFKSDPTNRRRIGFVAQDVLQALKDSGMKETDFDGYVHGVTASLRYEEFIALNTYEIQKLKKEITELKEKI